MIESKRPESWPVVPAGGPNLWPIPDTNAIAATAAGASLPDATWPALIAATLAFYDLGKKERTALLAHATRHAPALAAFDKKMPFAKGCALAEEQGLMPAFCHAMLLFGRSAVEEACKRLGEEATFAAISDWRLVEIRCAKKLPAGLSALRSLDTLVLLNPAKLKSDANVDVLAALPQRPLLVLEHDGRPDLKAEQLFSCVDLGLLTKGRFRGMEFKTTGSPVQLALEGLAPLARWGDLTYLSLRRTQLARPDLPTLAAIREAVPNARTLLLEVAPQGDWRTAAPGVELREGSDARLVL
ncbi:MAG: hypothetical protein JNL21_08060 [Myxococcales bacterium]|nr:hypothetical protein [Myxococcales bacterium]